jgi:hypothetical protein
MHGAGWVSIHERRNHARCTVTTFQHSSLLFHSQRHSCIFSKGGCVCILRALISRQHVFCTISISRRSWSRLPTGCSDDTTAYSPLHTRHTIAANGPGGRIGMLVHFLCIMRSVGNGLDRCLHQYADDILGSHAVLIFSAVMLDGT